MIRTLVKLIKKDILLGFFLSHSHENWFHLCFHIYFLSSDNNFGYEKFNQVKFQREKKVIEFWKKSLFFQNIEEDEEESEVSISGSAPEEYRENPPRKKTKKIKKTKESNEIPALIVILLEFIRKIV